MTQSNLSTKKHYQQLQPDERGLIQALHDAHKSCREIARTIQRSPSTVSREIKRGTTRQLNSDYLPFYAYFAQTGQSIYAKHRANCHSKGLLGKCQLFFDMLQKALKQRPRMDSVDGFVHRFQQIHPEAPCPSTPTVYRYIDQGLLEIRNGDLPKKLRRRVKSSNRPHKRLNKKILGTSIEERPEAVNDRKEFGHWEGDLIKGKRIVNEPALFTLTERMSRYEIIVKISDYHAATCAEALQSVIDEYGKANFKTITFDNGSEFAQLGQIEGPEIYFAHPYSPWERGSNENQNGQIREYIHKGKSLHLFSDEQIFQIQGTLNLKLRKSLNYQSASASFEALKQNT